MSPQDAKLIIKQATYAKVLVAVKVVTNKDTWASFSPWATAIAGVIFTALQALWSGGPSGVAKLVKMNEAVAAITAKIKIALPSVWLTLQAKLEGFLVAVLKKLT